MKIYPLQTGTVRVKQFQLTGAGNSLSRLYQLLFTSRWSEWLPIYSWLIDTGEERILVDTGETAKIHEPGYLPGSGSLFHKALQTRITAEEEINHALNALGYDTKDIHTVVLTHLHGDHAGGLMHFPHAEILVSRAEYEFATSKKGPGSGYFVQNWPDWFRPELIEYKNQAVGEFPSSYVLDGKDQITIVPTPGHSVGHQSVIVRDGGRTYFIGGDLTYNTETLKREIPNVILSNQDAKDAVKNTRQYVEAHSCVYLSSHDWNAPGLLSPVYSNG